MINFDLFNPKIKINDKKRKKKKNDCKMHWQTMCEHIIEQLILPPKIGYKL